MMQGLEINQDSLNAEVNYRREQLAGTTFAGRTRVHRLRLRRNRSRTAA